MIGKSYLISIYCIIRAVLYPNSLIVVAAGTKG
nr:MAG TPA: terminase-like protein [Siphoviridae sp. ctBWu8]